MNFTPNTYTNRQISIEIPTGWDMEEGEGKQLVSFSNHNGRGTIMVSKEEREVDLGVYIEKTKKSLSTEKEFKLLSEEEIKLENDHDAKTFKCSFEIGGFTFVGCGLCAIFNNNAYSVVGVVNESEWEKIGKVIVDCTKSLRLEK